MSKSFYKNTFAAIILAIFLGACAVAKKDNAKEVYLPTILDKIKLGMSLDQVLKLHPKAYPVNSLQETPRFLYTEDFETEDYQSVFYFFSKTEPKILVEINILHNSKESAEKTINQYFGEQKNKKQNQWEKELKDGTIVYATWDKKKVFIYIEEKKTEKGAEE